MAERDYLEESYTIGKTGIFDIDGVYRTLIRWFKRKKYDYDELEYNANKLEGKEKIDFKIRAKKKTSDYIKNVLEIKVNARDIEKATVKKKKVEKGTIKIQILAYLEKDYEGVWATQPIRKFLREFYDKFVTGSRIAKYLKDLEKDALELKDDLKKYLNISKK